MSRLVVVSNRVAVPGENRAGGLAVGLLAALKERGGMWFGWSGKTVRGDSGGMHEQTEGDITFVTMDLNKRDIDSYYNGFANRTLCHCCTSDWTWSITTAPPAKAICASIGCSPKNWRRC